MVAKSSGTSAIKEIADATDVVGTYQVWLRCEQFRGMRTQNAFEASERSLSGFIGARVSSRNI